MHSLLVSDFITSTIDVGGMVTVKEPEAGEVDMEVREVGAVHLPLGKTLEPGILLRPTTKSHGRHSREIP